MKGFSYSLFLGAGLLVVSVAATAQSQGSFFHDSQRDNPYGRQRGAYGNGRYGDERNGSSLISRVMSDLNSVGSNARLDGHERKHVNEAMRRLDEFQSRWAQGNFDTGRLDKAIENVQHLANADRVRGRDRDRLNQDLAALRQFRSTRGGNYGADPYYRNNRRYW